MKTIIKGIGTATVYAMIIPAIFLVFYCIIGLLEFFMSDPLNFVKEKKPYYTPYEKCVEQVNKIYDNINDTVGATYATEDIPTSNISTLINQCIMFNYYVVCRLFYICSGTQQFHCFQR